MIETQPVIVISPVELLNYVYQYKDKGYRLVQIHCTRVEDCLELNYSFALDYAMETIRFLIDTETEIHSISSIFEPAFLYENEIHDLFGVTVTNMPIDYHGQLYKLQVKHPYKPTDYKDETES